jgi:uncharacterized protein (TIGR02246 family)
MRTLFIAAALAFAPMLAACETLNSPTMLQRGTVMEAARRVSERYASTWNANDMAGFGALYAGDARHVNLTGGFMRGRTAIVTAHRASRERFGDGVRMVTQLEGARAITNDTIVAVMRVEYVNVPAQPNGIQAARLTLTLARRAGAWVIAQAQASEAS